jgi:hypothetical protein
LISYIPGIDSIEAKLNTTQTKFERPEAYWQELGQFRDQHREECVSSNRGYFDGTVNSVFDITFNELTGRAGGNDQQLESLEDAVNHKCKF